MSTRYAAACLALLPVALSACTAVSSSPRSAAASPAASVTDADSWVVGRVTNGENGNVISAVSLTLYYQEVEATPRKPLRSRSNAEGKFEFGPVTTGLYCVLASSFGYHSVAREFTLQRGKRDTVDIALYRKNARVRVQRCLPDRASIRMCPDSGTAARRMDDTKCSGQA